VSVGEIKSLLRRRIDQMDDALYALKRRKVRDGADELVKARKAAYQDVLHEIERLED
jgi:hypothetical protein